MLVTDATSLPRLMACIGSRLLPEVIVPSNGGSRDEGDAVHWIIGQIVRNDGVVPAENVKAANGIAITAEMIEHADTYITTIRESFSEFEIDTSLQTNTWRVNGRADHIAYDAVNNTLHVDDFKYGWRIVEPERNYTLLWHAIGYCLTRALTPAVIHLSIHQPRPYHPDGPVRTWQISYPELMAYYVEITDTLANPSDIVTTGPQCHYCPSLGKCAAARKAALNVVDLSEAAYSDDLHNDDLSRELDLLKRAAAMISDRIGAVENQIRYRLSQGQIIENYALEQGMSNTRWKAGLTAEALTVLIGPNAATLKAVTPAEAKRRGVSEDVVKLFTERVPTSQNLVRVDADKRARRLLKGKK